jgi:hypothetical protein
MKRRSFAQLAGLGAISLGPRAAVARKQNGPQPRADESALNQHPARLMIPPDMRMITPAYRACPGVNHINITYRRTSGRATSRSGRWKAC